MSGQNADKVAPGAGLIEILDSVEDKADAHAHQHTHTHTEDEGVDGADLEQRTSHGGSAGDGVIEAHGAEHAAEPPTFGYRGADG